MLIAIIGTPSSGKGAIVEYLIQRFGFLRLELHKHQLDETTPV